MYLPESEERRFVLRLLDYWQVVRGDREFPKPEDMNLNDMGKDAASSALLELANRPEGAIFRHVGLRLRPPGWSPEQSRTAGEAPQGSLLQELLRNLAQVIDRPVPLSLGGAFRLQGRAALGRSILLPLSADGLRATHVFGGINYRFVDRTTMDETA